MIVTSENIQHEINNIDNTEEEMIRMLEFEGSTQVAKVNYYKGGGSTQNTAHHQHNAQQEDDEIVLKLIPKTSDFSPNLKKRDVEQFDEKDDSLQLSIEQASRNVV